MSLGSKKSRLREAGLIALGELDTSAISSSGLLRLAWPVIPARHTFLSALIRSPPTAHIRRQCQGPLAIRARGMSAATIANWLANLVVALTFLDLVAVLGTPVVFFLYATLTIAAFVFARVLVPETKGLGLEAVEALWERRAHGD